MRCELNRQINRRRAVSTADDTDAGSFFDIEAEDHSAGKCDEYTELCCSTKKHRIRVCNHRTEVRHCTDTHENNRWENFVSNTEVNSHHDVHFVHEACLREISHDAAECNRRKEQRLVLFDKCHVEQEAADQHHDNVSSRQCLKSTIIPNRCDGNNKRIPNFHSDNSSLDSLSLKGQPSFLANRIVECHSTGIVLPN